MLAARSPDRLDCGPMSGFDVAKKVTAAFFAGTSVKANFLCNLGHGHGGEALHPRSPPALMFDEAFATGILLSPA